MIYQSTRNNDLKASSAQAILDGTKQPGDVYFGAAVGEKAE